MEIAKKRDILAFADKARYFEYLEEKDGVKRTRCKLCPRLCIIREGSFGYCGVRGTFGGELKTFIYGRPSSFAVDPIEKKPLYHFYPGSLVLSMGTIGCNMRCKHCQNWTISFAKYQEDNQLLTKKKISPEEIIRLTYEYGAKGVSFTYNEPTIWIEYVLDVFDAVKSRTELYTVAVTNAFITKEALIDLLKVTDSYRADLKTIRPKGMVRLTQFNKPETVLEAIALAAKSSTHLEVVTNLITNWNDSEDEITEMARWMRDSVPDATPWHFTRYFPYLEMKEPPTPLATLMRAREIARDHGFKFVYIGNVPEVDDNTYCPNCGSIVVERMGYSVSLRTLDGRCPKCKYSLPFRGLLSVSGTS